MLLFPSVISSVAQNMLFLWQSSLVFFRTNSLQSASHWFLSRKLKDCKNGGLDKHGLSNLHSLQIVQRSRDQNIKMVLKNDIANHYECGWGFCFLFFYKKHLMKNGVIELLCGRVGHMNYYRIVWKYAKKKHITLLFPGNINVMLGLSGL